MKRPVPARALVSVFSDAVRKVPPLSYKRFALRNLTFLSAVLVLILAFSPTPTSAITPAFSVGQHVGTVGATNVRATADGTKVGTQPAGSTGTILAGPVTVTGNSVIWYQVNFATAPSGWVGGDMLTTSNSDPAAPKSVVVGTGTAQTMVLDEFGTIELGWTGAESYQFSESTNQGLTFSAPSSLPMKTQVPAPPTGPAIAVERNGTIDVAYACLPSDCTGHLGNQSVQMIRSTDHGTTWSAPIQISLPTRGSGFGAQEPVVAACGSGVTVAWQDDGIGANFSATNPDIILVHVINGVPGTPLNLSNSAASEGHPQIAINSQSNVFVSWVTDNNQGGGTATDSVIFTALPNCGAVQK